MPAPVVSTAKPYDDLLARGLVGISDQVLRDHLTLYRNYCTELAMLDSSRPPPWRQPPAIPGADLQLLLMTPVAALPLAIEGQLAEAVAQVEAELHSKGIAWRPHWYIGDGDFWTTDQAVSINLPWYLANETLWQVVNEQDARVSRDDVVRILRHEIGHALGYAYELWKEGLWKLTFGDFFQPYVDSYTPDPTSTDFVMHLHELPSSPQAHYAQKHPDEDWAESFAVWLDPGSRWREAYAAQPGALAKLEAVQTLIVGWGRSYGPPVNTRIGRTTPFTTLDYTVADYLGVRVGPDPHDDQMRRLPEVYAGMVLHELYFDGLARGAGAFPGAGSSRFLELAASSFGGLDAFVGDLRAAARASTGWVLTVLDRRNSQIRNVIVAGQSQGVPPNVDVLLALDVHEHAYAGDVGIRKDVYVGAWWRNVSWPVVEQRVARALPPALPQLWGVTYAAPAARGKRKSCGSCRFATEDATLCFVVAGPISPEMVCGYHVDTKLMVSPDLAGLELVPGGTSCDRCRFYTAVSVDMGACAAVAGADGQAPAMVAPRGCCSRWEGSGLVPLLAPPPQIAEAVPAGPPVAPIVNAVIVPTPSEPR